MNIYFIGMVISMVIYVIIGLIISRRVKTADDFFVAGRNAPTVLIVGSLVASYCSTGLFMGDAGEANSGIFIPLITEALMIPCGYLLGSVFFGKYLRRSNALTIPEFFGTRFQSKRLRKLAAITAIITMVVYLLSVMEGIGSLMSYVTGVDYNLCILLALITFTILCFSSGSEGVLMTDTILFSIFTISALVAIFVIVNNLGGWYPAVANAVKENADVFSWHGDLSYLYPTGVENLIWSFITGVTWICVCGIAPWQSSRYLMAKNEHVVVRSSVYAAIGVGLLQFLIPATAALLTVFNDEISSPEYTIVWAAMNIVPTILGVILLTGILAAAISSATTFLSLIGSSVANDLFNIKDGKKKVWASRIAIVATAMVVMILTYINPPQIFIVMLLSATVVTCSWAPVCVASVWSKKITEAGAFWGMLFGFVSCALVKILESVLALELPIYCDPFFIGLFTNIIIMVIVSRHTKLTQGEIAQREHLMTAPVGENDKKEIKRTKNTVKLFFVYGVGVIVMLLVLWVIPYNLSL